MRIVENILGFLSRNKKNIFYILLFVFIFFHSNDFAFAATDDKEKSNIAIKALNSIISGVSFILAFLTMLIGLFLRPEWTSGSVIGLDTQLKTLWILVSNIVYLVFAGIFVTIAFMNIIGHGDHYELKKAIPKFIVGVIIVPFSWFFVQFILSLSSILTVSVLSLPYDTFPDLNLKKENIPVCEKGWKVNMASGSGAIVECKGGGKPKPQELGAFIKSKDNSGLFSIMYIYTYGVMRLDEKSLLVAAELKKGVTDIWSLGLKLTIDVIFIIVYLLLLVALFLAFMVRGIALWFYIMFSPLFGLLHFFGHGKDGMGDGPAKKFNLTEFIGLAFVPVYVAAALSFGLLFLFVAGKGFTETAGKNLSDQQVKFTSEGTLVIGNNELSGDAIKGMSANPQNNSLAKGFTGPIGALFLEMLGLAVLWVAVMAALHQSKITEGVSAPIAHFGDEIGKLVAKAPTFAPIIPGGLSAQGLQSAGSAFSSAVQNDFTQKGAKFGQETAKQFGFGDDDMNKLKQMSLRSYAAGEDTQKGIRDLLSSIKPERLVEDNYRREVGEVLRRLGAKDDLVKKVVEEGKNRDKLGDILHDFKGEKGWTKPDDSNRIFAAKSNKEIDDMIGMAGGSSSSGVSSPSGHYVKNDQKSKDGTTVININGANEKTGEKIDSLSAEISIKGGKITSGDNSDLIKTLESYKNTRGKDGITKILQELGLDGDEVKRILAKLGY